MRHMIRTLLIALIFATPALAADPVPDPELLRLQAAENAVRAGASTPRAFVRNTIPMEKAAAAPAPTTQERFLALQRDGGAPVRDFPVPSRREALPTSTGVKALVAAGTTTPIVTPPTTDPNADNAAAGLSAIHEFRRSRGLQ